MRRIVWVAVALVYVGAAGVASQQARNGARRRPAMGDAGPGRARVSGRPCAQEPARQHEEIHRGADRRSVESPGLVPGEASRRAGDRLKGRGGAMACGACHLMSGLGPSRIRRCHRPHGRLHRSADGDFKSGAQDDRAHERHREGDDDREGDAARPRSGSRRCRGKQFHEGDRSRRRCRSRSSATDACASSSPAAARSRSATGSSRCRRIRTAPGCAIRIRASCLCAARQHRQGQGARRDRRRQDGRVRDLPRPDLKGSATCRGSPTCIRSTSRGSSIWFKDGTRNGPTPALMKPSAIALNDEDIVASPRISRRFRRSGSVPRTSPRRQSSRAFTQRPCFTLLLNFSLTNSATRFDTAHTLRAL